MDFESFCILADIWGHFWTSGQFLSKNAPKIRLMSINDAISWLKRKKLSKRKEKTKIVSLQPNISNAPFDRRSPRLPEEGVLRCHRPTQCVGL